MPPEADTEDDQAVRLPWIGVGAVVAATATGAALRLAMLADPATAPHTELSLVRVAPAFVVAAVVGALALDRGNRTGRALLALGGAFATLVLTEGWAHFALLRPGPPLPLARRGRVGRALGVGRGVRAPRASCCSCSRTVGCPRLGGGGWWRRSGSARSR